MFSDFGASQVRIRRRIRYWLRSPAILSAVFALFAESLVCLCKAGESPVEQCIAGIEAIQSYNVSFRIECLGYDDPGNTPVAGITMTNSDVFAVGFGRRIESWIGLEEAHEIAVIDWKRAKTSGRPLSLAIRDRLPGFGYLDYLNPILGRRFSLTELLRDKQSKIDPAYSANSKLIAFHVTNPRLQGRLSIWLDSEHGNMPRILEVFEHDERGTPSLTERLAVERFVKPQGLGWVPARAEYSLIVSDKPVSGKRMELFTESCSWNSITSDEPFQSKNLPSPVNHSSAGWDYNCPPVVVAAKLSADAEMAEIYRQRRIKHLIVMLLVISAPLVVVMTRKLLITRKQQESLT